MEICTESPEALQKAVEILKKGGVVAHATDTCYGFAASIRSEEGIKKIYALKKMLAQKPVSILVSDIKSAEKYGLFNATAERFAEQYWPGQLTIIVERTAAVPNFLNKGSATIGLRLPAHDFSRHLVELLGCPVTTTSANVTGESSPYSAEEVFARFNSENIQPDLIIDSGRLNKATPPSTIIDCSSGAMRLIRKGSITV